MKRHRTVEPAILYLGTPVVLVSTVSQAGLPNLSPMSSAWWLGWTCVLGFDASSKTVENMLLNGQCVLNLPSDDLALNVDRLVRTTGSDPMPRHKQRMGYRYVSDKFTEAGLTPHKSDLVSPPRVLECPIQLEAEVVRSSEIAVDDPRMMIPAIAIEVRIVRVHASAEVLSTEFDNRIDPRKWNPLFMSFLEFYSKGERLKPLALRRLNEEAFGARRPVRLTDNREEEPR
ncbi:flavin reductase family protein [Nitratireductor sp. ZSWI3]|uniref:flavin reductase family protein n=1 Tax=Nitratireductor sp. ZSWI3 TaxID=2966359 RepID=UPI00214FF36F|nr:flavin reductase family protein [Nitratireductor sp. ZSWI3]MCR4266654.1 flavin reductase family protein [Nitratireductor sp. ZSWI3]